MANQTGRPTVITPDIVRKLKDSFREGFNVIEACMNSGISRTAYYERFNSDEDFANTMMLAKSHLLMKAKYITAKAIEDGNVGVAKWYLERRARKEFGPNPVDLDSEWENQTGADGKEDTLLQCLEAMREIAIADGSTVVNQSLATEQAIRDS